MLVYFFSNLQVFNTFDQNKDGKVVPDEVETLPQKVSRCISNCGSYHFEGQRFLPKGVVGLGRI